MTENIFENGGEFCLRGDPEHKPVEWYWFRGLNASNPVRFISKGAVHACSLDGSFLWNGESDMDLVPIPKPPEIVPWESPDDVPDGIWIRTKSSSSVHAITGISHDGVVVGGSFMRWDTVLSNFEYHTDRRAKDGWKPCGKVKQ